MKYAIIGSGAIGIFYGSMLAKAGNEVFFLFHKDYEHVRHHGLTINSVNGDFVLPHVNAYNSTHSMPACDVVLVCLKTNNNNLLLQILPPLLHAKTLVILIQNGLGLEQQLSVEFPNLLIGGGLAFICSNKTGEGTISHLDYGKITLGTLRGITPELEHVGRDFEKAGVPVELAPDLHLARWKKLVWNVPFNGLAVALNCTTDRLMQQAQSRKLVYDLMLEVLAGAAACGAEIPVSFADQMMVYTDRMRPYKPSMKLDFDNKRPMEIDAIYIQPVLAARAKGVRLNKMEMLAQQLFFIQSEYL